MKGKIVAVHWRDSNMYLRQCSKDDDFDIETIISLGFVVSRDKKKVVISGDVIANGDVRRVIAIPVENIIKIEKYS